MDRIIEESVESRSVAASNQKQCFWSSLPLAAFLGIISYLDRKEIVVMSVFLGRMRKNFAIRDEFFKAAYVEHFGLRCVTKESPE